MFYVTANCNINLKRMLYLYFCPCLSNWHIAKLYNTELKLWRFGNFRAQRL